MDGPDGKVVLAPAVIKSLGVWVVSPSGQRDPLPLVDPSDVVVPSVPISIDPIDLGGSSTDPWMELTHSTHFTLRFNRRVPVGTEVVVGWWRPPAADGSPADAAFGFTVKRCVP